MRKKKPKTASTSKEQKRKDENRQLHDTLIETLAERELSNSEHCDKAILAYSTGGLALSLTFLKDDVPFDHAIWHPALYIAWICFVLAISSIMISFAVSQRGHKRQRVLAKRYYIDDVDTAFDEPNKCADAVEYLNDFAGSCFIIAVISVTIFAYVNLDYSATMMNNKNKAPSQEYVKPGDLHEAAPVAPRQQKTPHQGTDKKDSGGSSGKK